MPLLFLKLKTLLGPFLPTIIIGVLLAAFVFWIRYDAVKSNDEKWEARIEKFEKMAQEKIDAVRKESVEVAEKLRKDQAASNQTVNSAVENLRVFQRNLLQATNRLDKSVTDLKSLPPPEPGDFMFVNNSGRCEFVPEYIENFRSIRNSLPEKP